ncbi:MAG: anhydro-N-acetylmuramic acid kinase [candidate division Zixibacteria bacterium]|nr:anhydro-N-acetylmuramic acid kinase [candidate division Zixibacteria bacterium]
MYLARIVNRKQLTMLGLNSGTSADGLDMAVVKIRRSTRGVSVKYLAGYEQKFSGAMRELVHQMADSDMVTLEDVIELDNLLGNFFGRTARSFIERLERQRMKVDVIASHGQTVRHRPEKVRLLGKWIHGTMQLGSLDRIAAATDRITVGDFRQADIAVGNEGAPITTGAMQRLFAVEQHSRLMVNIGGMANYFYFPAKDSPLKISAADCGPGNSLCDLLSRRLFSQPHDSRGRIAASGRLHNELFALLTSDDFFSGRIVSTGRERFGAAKADSIIAFGRWYRAKKADLMRTAAELTVYGISHKLRPLVNGDHTLTNLYLTGGGRRNIFFVRRLGQLLPELTIRSADELGFDADFIEAAAYAVMGEACLRGEALPTTTTNKQADRTRPVLGRIAQPPHRDVRMSAVRRKG